LSRPTGDVIGEAPAYALGKPTALGKAASHRFVRECPAVVDALVAYASKINGLL
jgi:hypothetical protein